VRAAAASLTLLAASCGNPEGPPNENVLGATSPSNSSNPAASNSNIVAPPPGPAGDTPAASTSTAGANPSQPAPTNAQGGNGPTMGVAGTSGSGAETEPDPTPTPPAFPGAGGRGPVASNGGAASGGTNSEAPAAGGGSGGTNPTGSAGAPMGGASSAGGASSGGAGGGNEPESSPGCGQMSTLTFGAVPGESGDAVGFGEGGYVQIGNRGFAMRLPDDYDSERPYPLIFGFHWNGGNSKEVDTGGSNGYEMAHFGLQQMSNNGAIFVAPDGLNAGWGNSGGQDLEFVDEILELIQENYCVDTTRIFANGFSYGGGMSYAIACARADVFRAVAIYNGAVLSGCDGGTEPIAFWQMAGQTDGTCTIEAGRAMRDRFVENNGCTPQDPEEPPLPPPYLSPGGHICTTYTGCSDGHPLRWCAHQSGHGNAIVDGTADLFHGCATPPNSCSDTCPCSWVPEDVWSFFTSL
jgi:hypothetical protein